jgi:hypothetical protein
MAITPLQHVQPGQLITAAWANEVVDEINAIIAELAATGSPPDTTPSTSGPPVLLSRTPSSDVHVNDQLTLIGQNFTPRHSGLTRINFGGVQITESGFLTGSNDTHLRFQVPNVPPGSVGVTVSTPQGTSSMLSVNVLPAVVHQGGSVHVDPANDPDNPPTPHEGTPLLLHWTVSSDTVAPDEYAFSVDFHDVTPSSQHWQAVLNANSATIAPGSPHTVVATVTVPHEGTANVTLTATSATDSQRHQTSLPLSLAVDVPTPTSDSRIALNVPDPQPDTDENGDPSNAALIFEDDLPVLLVAAHSDSFVQIRIHFSDMSSTPPLHYRFFAAVEDETNWTVGDVHPPTLVQTMPGGTTNVLFSFTNNATDGAPHETTLTVSAAKLQPDGTTDDYVSFAPITLRNILP